MDGGIAASFITNTHAKTTRLQGKGTDEGNTEFGRAGLGEGDGMVAESTKCGDMWEKRRCGSRFH